MDDNNWQNLLLISASLKTGLLQSIAQKSQTALGLAKTNDYDLRAVEIVMGALQEIGLVSKENGYYKIEPAASPFVDKSCPNYIANSLLHNARLLENWTRLSAAIKTGKSQTRRRSENELEIFVESMDELSRKRANEAVSLILGEHKKAKNVLDLGGASGTYARIFRDKGLKTTVIDTESVIKLAKGYPNNHDIELIAADFTKEMPSRLFDIILMSNITHIYRPKKLENLFCLASTSLADNGICAIVDLVRKESKTAAMFAVNMLLHTAGGNTWTILQYQNWLKKAHLSIVRTTKLKNSERILLISRKRN